MNITTATEVRVTNVTYIDNKSLGMVSIMRDDKGFGLVFRPTRVKVIALRNGNVSVKGLGRGGFNAMHVPGSALLALEGEKAVALRDLA